MSDKIEIMCAEFTDASIRNTPFRLNSCSWHRNGKSEFGWREGHPIKTPIPDDVRIALALLVAPGLVCPVGERDVEIARLRKPTTEMITKAWEVFRGNRRGRLLGEGPAFREAFEAAFSALDPKGDQP